MCHPLLRISGSFVLQISHALTAGTMRAGHSDSLFIQPRGKGNTRSYGSTKDPNWSNPKQKSNAEGLKLTYRATVTKTARHWYKRSRICQYMPMCKIEDPETNPHGYSLLTPNEKVKNTDRIRRNYNKPCWERQISICKRMELDWKLLPCTRINSTWIKDIGIMRSQSKNRNVE